MTEKPAPATPPPSAAMSAAEFERLDPEWVADAHLVNAEARRAREAEAALREENERLRQGTVRHHPTLEECQRIKEGLREENARLRKALEDAPHAISCNVSIARQARGTSRPCDCWKALSGKERP